MSLFFWFPLAALIVTILQLALPYCRQKPFIIDSNCNNITIRVLGLNKQDYPLLT